MRFAEVVVNVKSREIDHSFHYSIPSHLHGEIVVGSRVMVPFGPRRVEGYVVSLVDSVSLHPDIIRPIAEVLDDEPPLTEELVHVAIWISRRYLSTKAGALQSMLPGGMRAHGRQILTLVSPQPVQTWSPAEQAMVSVMGKKRWTRAELFRRIGSFSRAELTRTLHTLLDQGVVQEEATTARGIKEKTLSYLVCRMNDVTFQDKLEEIPERAFKQKEVAHFVRAQGAPVAVRDVLRAMHTSMSTIHALVKRGIVESIQQAERRNPYKALENDSALEQPKELTSDQRRAFERIVSGFGKGQSTFLLQGVTGSGKTEVYLQAIAASVEQGKEAIVLVPEISLTPQMVERFKKRFGESVAVMHSGLSQGERYDEWARVRRGKVKIAVGARSAIFAPFQNVGLIIIDEEHESSYKQEDHPKYHARDVALHRAKTHGAVLVLGSATPSLDSRHLVDTGSFHFIPLPERVNQKPLPPVEVVDMRHEMQNGNRNMFSKKLQDALSVRLTLGEQSILFLNRRGHSTFILCRNCGYVARCPHCDVALTYHQNRTLDLLKCHYCGHSSSTVEACPACKSPHIRHFGVGTQKVEEELLRVFPGIRVIRMDVDTTSTKGSHERLLREFGDGKADVLLGTQMIAKGLDFPRVTLVGVITADTMLQLPDFRASERTFQLLTQVAGRAGRSELQGEVLIQTYQPTHYAVQYAMSHDYEHFYKQEIEIRKSLQYPPFWELSVFTSLHDSEKEAQALMVRVEKVMRSLCKGVQGVILYDTVPAPISRIQGQYRFQHLVKYRDYQIVQSCLQRAYDAGLELAKKNNGTILLDVKAQMLL